MGRRERGTIMLLFTIMALLVGLPLIGLAVDGAVVFWAKAKLSSAVDAAALAAGRAINTKMSLQQNTQPVQSIGTQWFWANFPDSWLNTQVINGGPVVTPAPGPNNTQIVTVSASAVVPTFFMRVAGFNSITISAQAQSSRRSSYIVLVLDRSGSMAMSGACAPMQQDAVNFVNDFTDGFDTMALVTYSSTAGPAEDFPPNTTFKAGMASVINQIQCTGATSMAQALHTAAMSIKNNGVATGLNAIVLFTDGQPNEVVADYPVKRTTDTRYGFYPPGYGQQDYNTLYSIGPSPCAAQASPDTILGGLTILTNPMPPANNGMTGGLFDTSTQVPVSTSAAILNRSGCTFSTGSTGWYAVRYDIDHIPATDHYGNSTINGYGSNAPYFGQTVTVPATTASGYIRTDLQRSAVMAAGINAADYQAQVIRSDPAFQNFNIVVYTIGLGGAPDLPIDQVLLDRIANDSNSPIFDKTLPQGSSYYAPNSNQLNQAFQAVASQILRLSQ